MFFHCPTYYFLFAKALRSQDQMPSPSWKFLKFFCRNKFYLVFYPKFVGTRQIKMFITLLSIEDQILQKIHCFPAATFLSQKYNKTLSKKFFWLLIKLFHLDFKQSKVERRGDKLICPLLNWEAQVSGSSQQELQTGPESGSLRPPWSPRPTLTGQAMSWTASTSGVLLATGWGRMCQGSPGTWVVDGPSSFVFLFRVYDLYLQSFASVFHF